MKGISTVIATILMLMITIALAGTAYLYISGTFTQQTAVVLEFTEATCTGDPIVPTVQNSGTAQSGTVTVSATAPDGTSAGAGCTIPGINPGTSGSCSIDRTLGKPIGTYTLRASVPGARATTGFASCTTVGA